MKLLENILESVKGQTFNVEPKTVVRGITLDSRRVEEGFAFVCVKGYQSDGHDFIDMALEKGAGVIILENPEKIRNNVPCVLLGNTRQSVSLLAANFYDHPSGAFKLVGITGTNGKTTCATLMYRMFSQFGHTCGLISTVDIRIGEEVLPAELTTPDPVTLQNTFRKMADAGVSHVFMEVSSHALDQGRVNAAQFDQAVFTNISRDHLDYHGSFKAYIHAKKLLFDRLGQNATALINVDDRNGDVMVQNTKARHYGYSLHRPSDFKGRILNNDASGLQMLIGGRDVFFRMIGKFNAYNNLAAYGTAVLMGVDEDMVLQVLSGLETAEGRLEKISVAGTGYTGFVDYAHTPDALENVLVTLKAIVQEGRIICVVGCGGNRDRGKRPLMGKIAIAHSDITVFTSDNPRFEDPEDILDDMYRDLTDDARKKAMRVRDRKEAIRIACTIAKTGDIVLVAGKGHEKYQEIKGERIPFNDKEIMKAAMQKIN